MSPPLVTHFQSEQALTQHVVDSLVHVIQDRHASGGAVIGFPTGATPLPVYRELIRRYRDEKLDLSRVTAFDLDEYFGLAPAHPHSFHRYLWAHLFGGLTSSERALTRERIHLLRGDVTESQVEASCDAYERAIRDAGGLDFVLLGIGATGHIAFNEPGSAVDSRTRLVKLDELTRADALGSFGSHAAVPTHALTMGVGTLLEARRIVLMASGRKKESIVRRALEAPISDALPATFLRKHPDARFCLHGFEKPQSATP